jgi:hypothetical protein
MCPRIFTLVLLVTAVLVLTGCDPPPSAQSAQGVIAGVVPKPPAPPPPPPPPGEKAATPAASLSPANPAAPTDQVTNPVAARRVETPAVDPTPSNSAAKPFIKLSVGIALPQTLPDGTQVGVSVDYKLLKPNLNSAAKYFWVIESVKGEIAMEVHIKPEGGNLAAFLPLEIRPGDGPFSARIDEVMTSGSRVTVSNVEPLR